MLKPVPSFADDAKVGAAAFRRLCVETTKSRSTARQRVAAAFRRLCVETPSVLRRRPKSQTAAFRRLCVETSALGLSAPVHAQPPSGGCVLKQVKKEQQRQKEQAAAFRRLCVETVAVQTAF